MTQEPKQPIRLAVGESTDPSVISPNSHVSDSNDSDREDEKVEVPNPKDADPNPDTTLGDRQITIANLSAS
jgi:hypothetical protein